MSTDAEWITGLTGIAIDERGAKRTGGTGEESEGTPGKGPSPLDLAEAFEARQRMKQMLLLEVRGRLAKVKVEFQGAMQIEVTLKEKRFKLFEQKAKLLNVEATQLDEADFEEILFEQAAFEPETLKTIDRGKNAIINNHELLKNAKGPDGKELFLPQELEREFWTPLMRERILPETFIADQYSLTQRMINQTNDLYLTESRKREDEGTATELPSEQRRLLSMGSDAFDMAGDLAKSFGGDVGENVSLALKGVSQAITTGVDVFDQLNAGEWADLASTCTSVLKGLVSSALTLADVPETTVSAVGDALDAGGSAVKAGIHFASGPKGFEAGVLALAEMVGSAVSAGASEEKNSSKKSSLEDLARYLPGAITTAVKGSKAAIHARNGDLDAAAKAMNEAFKAGFGMVRASQRKALEDELENDPEKDNKLDAFDTSTEELNTKLDATLGTSLEEVARKAEAARMGSYRDRARACVTTLAQLLEGAVGQAGLGKPLATDVGRLVMGGVQPRALVEAVFSKEFKLDVAADLLSKAVDEACAPLHAAAPSVEPVAKASATRVKELVTGLSSGMDKILDDIKKAQKEGASPSFAPAMDHFFDGLGAGLASAVDTPALVQALQAAFKTPEDIQKAQDGVTRKAIDRAKNEVDLELQASEAGLSGLTATEQAGADASAIDDLIAKINRDRMILNMATQLVSGGAQLLEKVVPAMAATAAGVKMVAQLIAAAQRLQQLLRWMDNRDDFEAAQSVLSSASRNFVRNQRNQLADHSVDAALQLAKMIGEAASMGGPAAAAGLVIAKVSDAAISIKEKLKKHFDEKELVDAWKLFRKSLANPGNRRLALQVREVHPTLAKYTIAWGALVEKDLLARNALRACNLNEASLNHPDSGVDKVVSYLETFYEEDQQLYASGDFAIPNLPQPLELSPRCWVQIKRAANQAGLWDSMESSKVDGLLAQIELRKRELPPLQQAEQDLRKLKPEDPKRVQLQTQVDKKVELEEALVASYSALADGLLAIQAGGAKADPKKLEEFRRVVLLLLVRKAREAGSALAVASTRLEEVDA